MKKYLHCKNISFRYKRGAEIFKDLEFVINENDGQKGSVVALMGASGSGKTTLLNLLLRTLNPQQGEILTNPTRPVISYVPQEPVLFEHLTPAENARYLSRIHAYKKHFDENLYHKLSILLGMEEVLRTARRVEELSGGQRQRIQLLRALSVRPHFILLDEPTNGLDAEVKLQFLNQLREIVLKHGILAIYVTHHKIEAGFVADTVAFIKRNEREPISHIYQGSIQEFMTRPPVLDAVNIFKYPTPNILRVVKDHNRKYIIPDELPDSAYYAVAQPGDIYFDTSAGMPYSILQSNQVYSLIDIKGQQIMIPTSPDLMQEGMQIGISRNALIYGPDKILVQ